MRIVLVGRVQARQRPEHSSSEPHSVLAATSETQHRCRPRQNDKAKGFISSCECVLATGNPCVAEEQLQLKL